ncbi:hypothetical protein ACJRO7_013408 [Eucalyptus globulus]|uniref:Pentatricopeptide repeat-containing protein n=1 Tax=Eucalyptus globulus TaxID=34317 RepID=A0ABD3KWN3_EUCGL
MASLKLSVSVDARDSRRVGFSVNPVPSSDRAAASVLAVAGSVHVSGASAISPFSRFRHCKVSRVDAEPSHCPAPKLEIDGVEPPEGNSVGETLFMQNPLAGCEKNPNFDGPKIGNRRDRKWKSSFRRSGGGKKDVGFVQDYSRLDVNDIASDLSVEECNGILRELEKCSDSKTLEFFEWMRSNGKLERNIGAYNLVLRVFGRREDWDAAEKLISQLSVDPECGLNYQVFNTLMFACYKAGRVEMGGKWFRMMLGYGVRPNIATFGMLMSLYQKGWKVEEAEFAFSQMRDCGIKCQSAYAAMITIYTRLRLYEKAEEIIDLLRDDDVILKVENWLAILNAYCQQGKLEEAEKTLVSMQEAGLPPNIVAYNTLITGYGKVSNMDAAQRIFQRLQDIGIAPDETTYRSMIEGWGRANNYQEAAWYCKELKRLGLKPNSSNLYTLINLQAKYGDEDGATKTLNDMAEMGCQYSSILGILLQAYERAGRIDKVPLLVKDSFYQHVLVNQTSCSTLVMAYVKNGLVDSAIKVMQDKRWTDAAFEEYLYHLLICSCKELGHFENAIKIYTSMPKTECRENMHILCTMIDTYSCSGQFTEAEELYMKLKSSGVRLDVIAFSIVVRMYVKAGSLKEACAVLEMMEKQKNLVPDVFLFRDMFRIYQRCGMQDKLEKLYYKFLRSGISWDQEMYNCVINCCSRALPVDELSRVFEEMLQCGFSPNTITFNVMLDVYGKAKLFKKMRKLFLMARKQGLADTITYNTIIALYGQNKDFTNMSSAIQEMQFDGFSVSLEVYNCMLDAYGKEGQMESFRKVLQRLKDSARSPDCYTYNIMMNIYGERGWIDEVADILKELKDCCLGPDLCSYNTLIKAYGIAGMVEEAVALIKEMREKAIEPDKVTYINLINALRKNDKFLEAVRWSLWMKQMGLG